MATKTAATKNAAKSPVPTAEDVKLLCQLYNVLDTPTAKETGKFNIDLLRQFDIFHARMAERAKKGSEFFKEKAQKKLWRQTWFGIVPWLLLGHIDYAKRMIHAVKDEASKLIDPVKGKIWVTHMLAFSEAVSNPEISQQIQPC
jgi:hypothetical protein